MAVTLSHTARELEASQARVKEHDKTVKELNAKLQRATADGTAAREHRDQLQVRSMGVNKWV
jgi:multidrug resistance efflux pump